MDQVPRPVPIERGWRDGEGGGGRPQRGASYQRRLDLGKVGMVAYGTRAAGLHDRGLHRNRYGYTALRARGNGILLAGRCSLGHGPSGQPSVRKWQRTLMPPGEGTPDRLFRTGKTSISRTRIARQPAFVSLAP